MHQQRHLDLGARHASMSALKDKMTSVGGVIEGHVVSGDESNVTQTPESGGPNQRTEPLLVENLLTRHHPRDVGVRTITCREQLAFRPATSVEPPEPALS